MFYNIILNSLDSTINPKGISVIKNLACENKDLIDSETFPVIICRYATAEEVYFYKELQKEYGFDLSVKEVKNSDNVFELFKVEIKQGEQEDIHLKEKPEIINKLQDGLDVLREEECCREDFVNASEMIQSKIREQREKKKLKFTPVSIYFVFIIWAAITLLIMFSQMYTMDTKLFVSGCVFCVSMGGALIYDYVQFKKSKQYYDSEKYKMSILQEIASQNQNKNLSIHRIENMIDTLQARNCLTLLPTQNRNVVQVEEYLKQLNTLKSINEIFSLH
jgi:hypothetical protein